MQIQRLAVRIEQRLKATLGHRRVVAVKRIAGKAHHLSGMGDLAKFGGQVQQAHPN